MGLFLQGRIDEAAILQSALSPSEIASLYNADAAGKVTTGPYITTAPALPDAAYGVAYTPSHRFRARHRVGDVFTDRRRRCPRV